MKYFIYKRVGQIRLIAALDNDKEFFTYLARFQVELKGRRLNYENCEFRSVFNNQILDSVYLGGIGQQEYYILNEYGSFVDPRNYYNQIVYYRKEWIYLCWGTVVRKDRLNPKKIKYIFRYDPVPDNHSSHSHPRYWKSYKLKSMIREVNHEDYLEYNRPSRRTEINNLSGWHDREDRANYGSRSWKRQKNRKQYMKHRR